MPTNSNFQRLEFNGPTYQSAIRVWVFGNSNLLTFKKMAIHVRILFLLTVDISAARRLTQLTFRNNQLLQELTADRSQSKELTGLAR